MRVPDKGGTCKVGVEARHSTAVVKAIFDLLMLEGPELLLALELNFAQADGLLLGN